MGRSLPAAAAAVAVQPNTGVAIPSADIADERGAVWRRSGGCFMQLPPLSTHLQQGDESLLGEAGSGSDSPPP